jgi:hypothetical protein
LNVYQKDKLKEIVKKGIDDKDNLEFVYWCIDHNLTPSDATRMLDAVLVMKTAKTIMNPVLKKLDKNS